MTTNRFESQEATIAPIHDAMQAENEANLFGRMADFAKDHARPLVAVMAVVAGMGTVAAQGVNPQPVEAKSSSWRGSPCDSSDYNTILCTQSQDQASRYCEAMARFSYKSSRANYAKGSESKLKVTLRGLSIGGCSPVGTRYIKIHQEQRAEGEEEFTRSSKDIVVRDNGPFTVEKTLNAPYDCKEGGVEARRVIVAGMKFKKGKGFKNFEGPREIVVKPTQLCK